MPILSRSQSTPPALIRITIEFRIGVPKHYKVKFPVNFLGQGIHDLALLRGRKLAFSGRAHDGELEAGVCGGQGRDVVEDGGVGEARYGVEAEAAEAMQLREGGPDSVVDAVSGDGEVFELLNPSVTG